MYCQKCGHEMADKSAICPACGTPVQLVVQPAAQPAVQAPAQPAAQPIAQATAQPAAQPVTQAPAQPVAQPAAPRAPQAVADPGTSPLIMGILSIVVALLIPFAGPIAGIVLGALGISKGSKVLKDDPSNSKARGGKITGIAGVVLSVIFFLLAVAVVTFGVFAASNINEENLAELQQQIETATSSAETSSSAADQAPGSTDTGSSAAAGTSANSSGEAASSQSTSGTGSASAKDYTGGQKFDTWAAECTGPNNQPTLYAITELKGWQFETLLQQLGYEYVAADYAWRRSSDNSYYGMVTGSNALTDEEIAQGDKGGLGTHAGHILCVGPFSSAREAISQMCQVTTEDIIFTEDDQSAMAVIYGPSMSEYLLMVNEDEQAGFYVFMVLSEEAVADGVFTSFYGEDIGSSISEIWKSLTGVAVGEYIGSR